MVCKREITREEAEVYLATGRTEVLENFISKRGRPFKATLFRKETGRHGFEFPPRGESGSSKKTGGKAKSSKKTTKKTAKKTTKKTAAKKTTSKSTSKVAVAKKTE